MYDRMLNSAHLLEISPLNLKSKKIYLLRF